MIGANYNPLPRTAPAMPRLMRLHLAGGDDARVYDALRLQTMLSPSLRHVRLKGPPCSERALAVLEDALFLPIGVETARVSDSKGEESRVTVESHDDGASCIYVCNSPINGVFAAGTETKTKDATTGVLEGPSSSSLSKSLPLAETLDRLDVVDALIPSFAGPLLPPKLAELAERAPEVLRLLFSERKELWREKYPIGDVRKEWVGRVLGREER